MSRQGKTKKRIIIVSVIMLALGATVGGAAVVRLHYIRQNALRGREDGLVAYDQGDYAKALTELGKFLGRNQNDADILLKYAYARQMVELPDGAHIMQAIRLYQMVLNLRPNVDEAQHHLFELYLMAGLKTEAISLADQVLAQTPGNTDALRTKTLALMRSQKLVEAWATVQKLTAVAPLDLDFRILELQIEFKREGPQQTFAYASRLAQEHPGDVHFELLRSIAAGLSADFPTAITLIKPLVTKSQVDVAYTRLLVRQLDSLRLFSEASSVLDHAAKDFSDPEIRRLWVRRLFETNRFQMLVEQTASLDPAARTSDVEVLAMRVEALDKLDRRPEAHVILSALDGRGKTEILAARWAGVLRATGLRETTDPVESITLLRKSLSNSPDNPILLQDLGDAYAAAGARDRAVDAWSSARMMDPGWAAPLIRLSQSLLGAGRFADALAAAKEAVAVAPQDHEALSNHAIASAAALPANGDPALVITMIANLQRQFPGDYDLVPLKVVLLTQGRVEGSAKRDEVIATVRAVLEAKPPASERTLIALAQASGSAKLNLEEDCFAASLRAHGLTSNLALARSLWMQAHERGPEALKTLDEARSGHADDVVWQNTWAQFLDVISDPRAKGEWILLGDKNPKNVKVQWGALNARSVQDDHDFTGRTIGRIEDLLGRDSLTLSLIRARWLLQGNVDESRATEASILLSKIVRASPNLPEPRLLLANCLVKLGNAGGAIEQLTAVADQLPDSAQVAVDLARLLHNAGNFARARQYLDRAAASKKASINELRQVASLLSLEGEFTTALALMEKAYAAAGGSEKQPPDLIMAALYLQLNQPQKCEDICRQLLAKPDVEIITFAADYFGSHKQPEEAKKVLALLESLKVQPVVKEQVLAGYAVHHGTKEEAIRHLQGITQLAPDEESSWRQLASYYVGIGKIDLALAIAEEGAHHLKSGNALELLSKNAVLIRSCAQFEGTMPLLMTLLGDPASREVVLQGLQIIADAARDKEPMARTALKFRQLADQNPRILALQTFTIQLYLGSKQFDEASNLATRTVQSFPASLEPLRIATDVFGAARRWDQQLDAAKEWRRLGASDTLGADLAIASARLQLGDTRSSSQQLQPYLELALQNPDKYRGVILLRAQTLLALHEPDQVEALVGPLLANSQEWRILWLNFAVYGVEDAARAKAWVDRVTPLMEQDVRTKTMLGEAWLVAGRRWDNSEFELKGRQLLEGVVASSDPPPPSALMALGGAAEMRDDWAAAEEYYRRVRAQDPNAPIPMNNLAFVLIMQSKKLDEAKDLASRAVEASPKTAAFNDTLADAQAALKDYPRAINSLKEAIRLEPQNLEWRINLLRLLVDSNQISAARTQMEQIAAAMTTAQVSARTRKRFDELRAKLQ